jgi:hypothetical protein
VAPGQISSCPNTLTLIKQTKAVIKSLCITLVLRPTR